ncbi:MFS general substrate transporter [Aureobasidium subglaciale]|nr:MFS general substrate transporter [Aureobasidium subglaciale]
MVTVIPLEPYPITYVSALALRELRDVDAVDPREWPTVVKVIVAAQICLYTFVVYLGSSIVLASLPFIQLRYGVSVTLSSLTIATYVFGYGFGALFFSPLSEIEFVGRNGPYLVSFACFVAISAATAACDNFSGLMILRFVQGVFGSPALATGAASMQDMLSIQYLPLAFLGWMGAATLGPAFSVTGMYKSIDFNYIGLTLLCRWRLPLWEMCYVSAFVFVIMSVILPETYHIKRLYDQKRRLVVSTQNSDRETQHSVQLSHIFEKHLYRPIKIMLTHPAVAFANIYTCLIYGLYYTFFECIPRVYLHMYHFSYTGVGLSFLSIAIGALLGGFAIFMWFVSSTRSASHHGPHAKPERNLVPALYASVTMPVGLLLFAWTSRPEIHWAVSLIGMTTYTASMFVVLQCLANYLILVHPEDAASLFAGNDFMRATTAATAIVASHPMYDGLGVAWGVSLLAGLTCICTLGLFWLYRASPRLYDT